MSLSLAIRFVLAGMSCPFLFLPDNTSRSSESCNSFVVVHYWCDPACHFSDLSTNLYIECELNGRWSNTDIACQCTNYMLLFIEGTELD